jgi:trehalose-6-phosphate synthase
MWGAKETELRKILTRVFMNVGMEVTSKEEQENLCRLLEEEYACLPVFISDEISNLHYNGFSNR